MSGDSVLIVVLVALGLALRPDQYLELLSVGAVLVMPPWITVPVVGAVAARVWRQRTDPFEEVVFLQALAAELRAGHSVRQAIVRGAERVPALALDRVARLAAAGRPMEEVADELECGLPESGALGGAAIRIGAECGGRIAAVFSMLAGIQSDVIDLRREVHSATATVRASAFVVGGLPVAGLVFATTTERLSEILSAGPSGVILVTTGAALLMLGAGSILAMTRTAAT